MKELICSLILLFTLLSGYSQVKGDTLTVRDMEIRTKEKGKWTDWTIIPDITKRKLCLIIDTTARTLTWETENDHKQSEFLLSKIASVKRDSSFADFKVDCLTLEIYKSDIHNTVRYKLCSVDCGKTICYRLISYADEKSTSQYRYLLLKN
jgi:hypothetical protein